MRHLQSALRGANGGEARAAGLAGRLGFMGGDFLNGPLPGGYDTLSFVRGLHD
jgi:hypothetical protein